MRNDEIPLVAVGLLVSVGLLVRLGLNVRVGVTVLVELLVTVAVVVPLAGVSVWVAVSLWVALTVIVGVLMGFPVVHSEGTFSCPESLLPQPTTLPFARSASVCVVPAARATMRKVSVRGRACERFGGTDD